MLFGVATFDVSGFHIRNDGEHHHFDVKPKRVSRELRRLRGLIRVICVIRG
jgi:hypothetical protein